MIVYAINCLLAPDVEDRFSAEGTCLRAIVTQRAQMSDEFEAARRTPSA
jgi:hypothetical protein